MVNDWFKDDPYFQDKLPLDPQSLQLFELCKGAHPTTAFFVIGRLPAAAVRHDEFVKSISH